MTGDECHLVASLSFTSPALPRAFSYLLQTIPRSRPCTWGRGAGSSCSSTSVPALHDHDCDVPLLDDRHHPKLEQQAPHQVHSHVLGPQVFPEKLFPGGGKQCRFRLALSNDGKLAVAGRNAANVLSTPIFLLLSTSCLSPFFILLATYALRPLLY